MMIHLQLAGSDIRGTETLDLWKGEGLGGEHGVHKMDITGTFRKESREFEGGEFGVD